MEFQEKLLLKFTDLYKASDDALHREGLLILQDLLNERVAESVASHPQDFNLLALT
jgi:hypothetical protein